MTCKGTKEEMKINQNIEFIMLTRKIMLVKQRTNPKQMFEIGLLRCIFHDSYIVR